MARELLKLFIMFWVAAFFWIRAKLVYVGRSLWFWRKHEIRTPIPRGHRLYMFDPRTGILEEQEALKTVKTITLNNRKYKVKDFKIKKGCVAVVALNDKNAIKVAMRNVKRGKTQPDERGIKITRAKDRQSKTTA
jgi:hypothetical protein